MPSVSTAARAVLLAACAAVFSPGCTIERKVRPDVLPAIVLHADTSSPQFGVIEVVNLQPGALARLQSATPSLDEWHQLLRVRTTGPDDSGLPLLGTYSVERGRLRFRPRFAPIPGRPYYVRFDGAALQRLAGNARVPISVIDTVFLVQRSLVAASTSVEQVYPTTAQVPVNLLRLYLHFSAPMSLGAAYRSVRLEDERGQKVEDAFLIPTGEQELWDPERRRLTLLFDPGRIKRDLRPHEEAGLPLREGGTFTLVIDSTWQDADGRPLVRSHRHRFVVGPADRTSPRTEDWQLTTPRPSTRDPVILQFPEPLDHALLARMLSVKYANGGSLAGSITVGPQETQWSFAPRTPWPAGTFYIEIDTSLEDLAGNNMRHLFDVDREAEQQATVDAPRVTIPFVLR